MNRFVIELRTTPQLFSLLLLILSVPLVFWSTTRDMIDVWVVNETFTHGFLILPISLWLIWEQRHAVREIEFQRDPRALLFLLPVLGSWIVATLVDVAVIQQLAMVALVPLIIWLTLGHQITQALLFPLCYLFFAVPLGQSLIPPMMEFTADFTVNLVQRSGVPIFRDGLYFQLPSGSWAVVEECSGVRYLIASAALGTIYAYITYRSNAKRLVFVVVSLVVPVLANGLRAYGIVMIGHLSDMEYAVGADHLLYGWLFFGIVIFILFWIGGFWTDPPVPRRKTSPQSNSASLLPPASAGVVVAILLGLNIAMIQLKTGGDALPTEAALRPAAMVNGWHPADMQRAEDGWRPIINNPDLMASERYQSPLGSVTLDLAYYHTQRDGAEAISSLNRLSDPYEGDWKLTDQRRAVNGSGYVIESELTYAGRKVLVWSVYLLGDRFIASAVRAKLYQALRLLAGERSASWVVLSTDYNAELPELQGRLREAWPVVVAPLPARVDHMTPHH